MNKISPSLMCVDMFNLKKEIDVLDSSEIDSYHVDIMDGHFVPNFCLNSYIIEDLKMVSDTAIDVHLMVTNPEQYIDHFAQVGADIITPHIEALDHPIRTLKKIRSLGKRAGLAINPATDINQFNYLAKYLDLVCVMTVDPGFSGQKMIPETLDKIERLKKIFEAKSASVDIMVDGQVKAETASRMTKAGTNWLVVGTSGLFNFPQEEYATLINDLKDA
ncbi:ribulose-phosphate 3-epimerase [Tetragenococcus halophilus]|nr:ribulose-phosphate 3-epimerase [Tetragenococcus halophilus]